jgi:hypothetical protein
MLLVSLEAIFSEAMLISKISVDERKSKTVVCTN